MLKDLISAFPFTVQAFHADNGSEYINHQVAELLNELHIPTFTKSRPRHSNDNALVESKNGSIVRRWLGHIHVPHALVPRVNAFLHDHLCPLLNFHRPCLFPTEVPGPNGRVKRRYRQEDVATPYERFKSMPGAEDFLRPGVSLDALDQLAAAATHLDAAKAVQRARDELLRAVGQARDSAGVIRLAPASDSPVTLLQLGRPPTRRLRLSPVRGDNHTPPTDHLPRARAHHSPFTPSAFRLVSSILGYPHLICRSGSRGWPGVLDARRGKRSEPGRASSTGGGRAVSGLAVRAADEFGRHRLSHVLNGYTSIEARTTSTGKGKNT